MKTQKIEVQRLVAEEVERRTAPLAVPAPSISLGGRIDRMVEDTTTGI